MSSITLVMGASLKPERYSNMAIRRLRAHGHEVVAVGLREGMVEDVRIARDIPSGIRVDTVTLYMNAKNQAAWQERLLSMRPRRIIFNPGAENQVLMERAAGTGVQVIEACTLVLLSTGQY